MSDEAEDLLIEALGGKEGGRVSEWTEALNLSQSLSLSLLGALGPTVVSPPPQMMNQYPFRSTPKIGHGLFDVSSQGREGGRAEGALTHVQMR